MRGANKEMNTAQTLEEVRKAISGGHKLLATVVWSDKASHRGPSSHLRVIRSDIDIFEPFLLHETSELVWIDYRVAARRRDTHFLHGKDLVCKSSNFLVAPTLFEAMSGRFPCKYGKKWEPSHSCRLPRYQTRLYNFLHCTATSRLRYTMSIRLWYTHK